MIDFLTKKRRSCPTAFSGYPNDANIQCLTLPTYAQPRHISVIAQKT